MENKQQLPDTGYKSELTTRERIAVLGYLPIHIWLLPAALYAMLVAGRVTESEANMLCYAIGMGYMLMSAFGFLRRDFDPLCDRPLWCLLQIVASYGIMLALNLCVAAVLALLNSLANPNNAAVMSMAETDSGGIAAMALFMAPIVEELLFRAGIFGTLRRYSRAAAYAVGVLSFSLYHVWAYAAVDPSYWIYLLQYLPVSFLMCRLYERTESIWCSIFFHMLVNAVSLKALSMLEGML